MDRVTVNTAGPLGSLTVTSSIVIRRISSSVIVPIPRLSVILPILGLLIYISYISVGSATLSSIIGTEIVPLVVPEGIVNVPLVSV